MCSYVTALRTAGLFISPDLFSEALSNALERELEVVTIASRRTRECAAARLLRKFSILSRCRNNMALAINTALRAPARHPACAH